MGQVGPGLAASLESQLEPSLAGEPISERHGRIPEVEIEKPNSFKKRTPSR